MNKRLIAISCILIIFFSASVFAAEQLVHSQQVASQNDNPSSVGGAYGYTNCYTNTVADFLLAKWVVNISQAGTVGAHTLQAWLMGGSSTGVPNVTNYIALSNDTYPAASIPSVIAGGINLSFHFSGVTFVNNRTYCLAYNFTDKAKLSVDGANTLYWYSKSTDEYGSYHSSTGGSSWALRSANYGNQRAIYSSSGTPELQINSPTNFDHDNVPLNVSYTVTKSPTGGPVNITLYINGTSDAYFPNATRLNIANGTTTNITADFMNQGHFKYKLGACSGDGSCYNTSVRTYIYDTTNPVITWTTPSSIDSASPYHLNMSVAVSDANLHRVNFTVYYSNNTVFSYNYSGNITTSSYSVFDGVVFPAEGNYTLEISAADSHTFGDLNGLTYSLDNKGITFQKGIDSKRIYFGYYNAGNYNFLTDQQIIDYNISASIIDDGTGQYSWHLKYNKPATSIKFGFAIEKQPNLILVNPEIGHFVWINGMRGWYMDFAELIDAGYLLNYVQKTVNSKDYHVIYTDTDYCTANVGEQCQI